jgi:hypothetical protein
MTRAEIEARGRAMREFADRVRERGGRAEVEEDEDLPLLRLWWRLARAEERASAKRGPA